MLIEVSDSMFMISARDGGEMKVPPLKGLVTSDGTSTSYVAVQAQDQFRPVRVRRAAVDSAPPLPDDFAAMIEFSVTCRKGLLVEDFEGEVQRGLTRASGDVRVRVCVSRRPPPRDSERTAETFTIEAWPAPWAPTIEEDRS